MKRHFILSLCVAFFALFLCVAQVKSVKFYDENLAYATEASTEDEEGTESEGEGEDEGGSEEEETPFTVTFYSEDGETVLDTQTVNSGDTLTYGGTEPTKTETTDYSYTFAGWTAEKGGTTIVNLSSVTTTTSLYAYFEATAKFFEVTFYDTDKTTSLYVGKYYYGEDYTVAYNGEKELTKTADKAYTYSLIWRIVSSEQPVTLSNINITTAVYADFEATAINYNITVYTAYVTRLSGSTGVTEDVNYSRTFKITSGTVSLTYRAITGYDFVGYTTTDSYSEESAKTSVSITVSSEDDLCDRTYYAWFTLCKFTVTFAVDDTYSYGNVTLGGGEVVTSISVTNGTAISISGDTITFGEDEDDEDYYVVKAVPWASDGGYIYEFMYWVVSSGSSTSTVSKDITITAYFSSTLDSYQVVYDSNYLSIYNTETDVEIGQNEFITSGTKLKIKIKKIDEHYHFYCISVKDSDGEITYYYPEDEDDENVIITINSYSVIEIVQEIDKHTITLSISDDGFGTVSQSAVSANYGLNISASNGTLTIGDNSESENYFSVAATAADATAEWTYAFVCWKLADSDDELTTTTLEEDMEIFAVFTRIKNQYTVTFESSSVTVTLDSEAINSGDSVDYGSVLTVAYTETLHYHMTSFAANGSPISGGSVTVTGNTAITYTESIDTFCVTFDEGVTLTISGGGAAVSGNYYEYGTQFIASYTLSKNYKLVSFTMNGEEISNNYSFTLTEDVTINFEEERDKIKITIVEVQNGEILLSANSIECGEIVTITAVANENYKLSEIYYIGSESGEKETIDDLSFIMPNEEITVYAVFAIEYYVLVDDTTGITIKVEASLFDGEPELSVEVVTSDFEVAASLYGSENYVVYRIVLIVGEEITELGALAEITIPISEDYESSRVKVYLLGVNDYYTDIGFSESEGSLIVSSNTLGVFAVGEIVESSSGVDNNVGADEGGKGSSNTTLIIVICLVGAAAITGAVVAIIIVKRRKRR